MKNIIVVCDYIIARMVTEEAENLDNLKMQKLLYYTQAWHLAFYSKPLFAGKFQAWIHGPVNREIFDRFKESKFLFTPIVQGDIITKNFDTLSDLDKLHIDTVLEVYGKFSGVELELMTHIEEPWKEARGSLGEFDRCENEIDEKLIGDYFRQRLNVKL